MPLAIVYLAGNHRAGVAAPQVVAEVGQPVLYLHRGEVGVVDAGHVEQQARVSRGSDFKFNRKPGNQMRYSESVGKFICFTSLRSSKKASQLAAHFTRPSLSDK